MKPAHPFARFLGVILVAVMVLFAVGATAAIARLAWDLLMWSVRP